MPTIDADGFTFTFPDSWRAGKYDDWAFYRNQFSKMNDGIKAVDVVAFDEENTLWLIEVKDFRRHGRKKEEPLHKEVWKKVYDTIAGLFAAKCNAVNEERIFARRAAEARKMRVVLHIERPEHLSRLYHANVDFANIAQQLKTKFKAIDPHPLVVGGTVAVHPSLQWSVSRA